MTTTPDASPRVDPAQVTQHEPEVRVLSRLAKIALLLVRAIFILIGFGLIATSVYYVIDPIRLYTTPEAVPPFGELVARQLTFVCAGLPLALPVRWTFDRGRWPMAAIAVLLVTVPMAFEQDPACCLIRAFACFVGCAAILVWRTLWHLRSS